jgi:cytochrome P450
MTAACMQCSKRAGNGSQEYDPAQWLSEDHSSVKLISQEDAFVAFGYGPRSCTGSNLAMIEIIVCMVRCPMSWVSSRRMHTGTFGW